ncbi:MAG: hypothetical protein AB7N76_14860 [Planctomycetota bacterium]
MNRSLFAASLLVCCAAAHPARADEWIDAMTTDLVEGKLKEALAKYEAVRKAGHAKAEEATMRRMQLFARYNKKDELLKECEEFLKAFPSSTRCKYVTSIKDKPEKFIQEHSSGLLKRLKTQKVTLNFDGTPLDSALDFVRDISGINIVVLPDVRLDQASVTLQLKDVSLEKALELMLASAGDVEHKATMGLLVIGKDLRSVAPHRWTRAEVQSSPAAAEKIMVRRVTLNFPGTELTEVVAFLKDILGVNVVLNEDARKANPKVSIRVRNVPCEAALSAMLGPQGMEFYLDEVGIRIRVKP